MSSPETTMRHPLPLLLRMVGTLVAFEIGLGLALSGCGPGPQGNTINQLNGIVALSASDAWAVGFATNRQGFSPLIEHWNGSRWEEVPAPGKGERSMLEGVAAHSAQDVWAVGEYHQGEDVESLIDHWNGHVWRVIPSPQNAGEQRLESVAAVSAIDVWAVGTSDPCPPAPVLARQQPGNTLVRVRPSGRADACQTPPFPPRTPLIEHWDGHTWGIVKSPVVDPHASSAGLSNVVAFSPDDVWAAGTFVDSKVTPVDGAALIEHWDGHTWSIMTSFDEALGSWAQAAAFLSSSDLWWVEVTPNQPDALPNFEHWNGTAWSMVAHPSPGGSAGYSVEAMAGSASDDLWAVGYDEPVHQNGTQDQVFSMHWNGRAWSLVPSPSPAGGYIYLDASVSLNPHDAWMVGEYDSSSDTQLTFLEHWDGHAWSLEPNPNPAQPAPASS